MAININAPLKVNAVDDNGIYLPKAEITYGPYESKAAAITAITSLYGSASDVPLGVSFGVVSSGTITEYQYKTGAFNDTNCVEVGAGSRSNGESFDSAFTRIDEELGTIGEKVADIEEDGFYVSDANGNYILSANSNGVNMSVSSELLNSLKTEISTGVTYDSIGYPVLNNTNPLATLIQGRSRARLFKTWGIVGASFETGIIECYNDGTATTMTDTDNDWPTLFGEMNNVTVASYAIGGSTLKNWLSSNNGLTKLTNDTAKQAYLVNMSSNDNDTSKYNEPIGDITTDIDYEDKTNNAETWVGCLATIIQSIREKAPGCYIFLATRRNASGAKSNTRINQMCQALRQVCTCFENVYLVDMWQYGADWDDSNFKKEFRCGGHPNRNGHIYLADAFNTYIDWIIRNNPIKMRGAAFIGTNYQDKDNY